MADPAAADATHYQLRYLVRDLGTLSTGTSSQAIAAAGHFMVGTSNTSGVGFDHAFAYDVDTGVMRDLGTLGGPDSEAVAISGHIVIGNSSLAPFSQYHAFTYDLNTGVMRDLSTPSGDGSMATAISGHIVVGQAEGHAFAYDLDTGVMADLGTLGGSASTANAVTGNGDLIAGTANTTDDIPHATIWIRQH